MNGNNLTIETGRSTAEFRKRTRPNRIRRYSCIRAFGGYVLFCTLFLPAVRACNSDFVPAIEMSGYTSNPLSEPENLLGFLMVFSPYAFGLLVFINHFRNLSKRNSKPKREIKLLIALSFITLTGFNTALALEPFYEFNSIAAWLGFAFLFFFLAIVGAYCRRAGPGKELCVLFSCSAIILIWYSWWLIDGALYGLWMSAGGTLLILIGSFLEARWRTQGRFWQTLGRIISFKLKIFDTGDPKCLNCGYLLFGLSSKRCPECGTPF